MGQKRISIFEEDSFLEIKINQKIFLFLSKNPQYLELGCPI